jgi:SRSO17 transposase
VAFATKPKLAHCMIARALDAGVPAGWVTADEVYGADPGLRAGLERRQIGYVLAVAATHRVATSAGAALAPRRHHPVGGLGPCHRRRGHPGPAGRMNATPAR